MLEDRPCNRGFNQRVFSMVAPLAPSRFHPAPMQLPTYFDREEWNAHPWARHEDGGGHNYVCARCGQAVDLDRLGDVLHHDQAEHDPVPPDGAVALPARIRRRARALVIALWMKVLLVLLQSEFRLPVEDYAAPEECAPW